MEKMQLEFNNINEVKKKKVVRAGPRVLSRSFVELFAGIGLVRMGLEKTGWKCIYANDIDPNKKEIYEKNFASDHFHLEDIWKVTPEDIPSSFDLMTASFPCIDLSLAGNRKGLAGNHSGTFWAFINLLTALKEKKQMPKAILVENVLGFMTSNGGRDFVAAVEALNKLGYRTDAFVVDARHFTPQSRPRLFIVGFEKSLVALNASLPSDTDFYRILMTESQWRPSQLRKLILAFPKLNWTLFDLPKEKSHNTRLKDIIEKMPDNDPRWWDADKVKKTIQQMSDLHIRKFNELKDKKTFTFGTIYRRKRESGTKSELRLDGFAGCLRTPRGGSSRQIVAKIGNGKLAVRWMTPREYARLQGVDDGFILSDSESKSLFGFGDAVCVPAIEWIAKNVIDPVLHESSREINKS